MCDDDKSHITWIVQINVCAMSQVLFTFDITKMYADKSLQT